MILHDVLGYPVPLALEKIQAAGLEKPSIQLIRTPSSTAQARRQLEKMTLRVVGVRENMLIVAEFKDSVKEAPQV